MLIRNDMAVLAINDQQGVTDRLKEQSNYLVFLKGNLKGGDYDALVKMPGNTENMTEVSGKLSTTEPLTGTTILRPDDNSQVFFFDAGSSGSPVYCSVELADDYPPLSGIGGYVDCINQNKGAKDARMIPVSVILELLHKYSSTIQLPVIDIDAKKKNILIEGSSKKIIKERGKSIYCNREIHIAQIKEHKKDPVTAKNYFLLIGDERQILASFVDRYRLQFIANYGYDSRVIPIKMPDVSHKGLFCHRLAGAIMKALDMPYTELTEKDPTKITIKHIADELLTNQEMHYVFDCRVENNCFDSSQNDSYTWFFNDFMSPFRENPRPLGKVHLFVSFYYREGAKHEPNKNFLIASSADSALEELYNITKHDVKEWLEFVEGGDVLRKNQIFSRFHWQESYNMMEVLRYYNAAIQDAEPF